MKSIVAKVSVILSIIFIVISICGISSINSDNIMRGLNYGDIRLLPYKQIPFFYVALIFVVLSSVIKFTKINKTKSIINIVISLIPTIFVLVTHDYIWFMILMNIYLVGNILSDISFKNKINMFSNIISIIVFIINEIQIFRHLQLPFDLNNMEIFTSTLIILSNTTLNIYMLWLIPYIILLINDIVIIHKHSIGGNS